MSLRAERITCVLDRATCLREVSVALEPGQLLAVLGPNGAGKSSLLRALAGDLALTHGQVSLDQRALGTFRSEALARRRAVLAQHSPLGFDFTVREVVALGRYPWEPEPAALAESVIDVALQAAAVAPLAQRRFTQLSAGERARVQFARVLAQVWRLPHDENRYLLLDEPTAALDLAQQHEMLAVLRALAGRGMGVLAILHDLNLAQRYADRVVLMRHGSVLAQGTPQDVLTPAHIRATFDIDATWVDPPDGGAPVLATSRAHGSQVRLPSTPDE